MGEVPKGEIAKIYTLDEVCEMLSITRRTVYTYIKTGRLKAFKMGKYWRVPEENLKELIANGSK